MNKRDGTAIAPMAFLVLLVISAGYACGGQLANRNKAGLYSPDIADVLRLPGNDIDIGTAALLLSNEAGAEINHRRYITLLDDMAREVTRRLVESGIGADARAIAVINRYLFEEMGFSSVESPENPRHLFLHSVMDGKKGYCLSLSILYMAIGERIGLPLYGVVVPGHFFVRYDDGRTVVNIETTSGGKAAPDEYYTTEFNVPQDASEIYMRNLSVKESLGCFLNNLSNLYSAAGDYDSARWHLDTAARITPGLSMIHSNLGNVYAREGLTELALHEYDRAARLNPLEARTRYNRANLYVELERYREAEADYRKAVELDPNFVDAYRGLAEVYIHQERFGLARDEIYRAIQVNSRSPHLWAQLGDIDREAGLYADAIAAYRKSLEIEPAGARALFGLAVTLGKLGDIDGEITAYTLMLETADAEEHKEHMRIALFNLGNAYITKGLYMEAADCYARALRLKAAEPAVMFNLGVALMHLEEYEGAAEAYKAVIAADKANAEAYGALAAAQYYLGMYHEAWHNICNAIQLGAEVHEELYKFLANQAIETENTP